MLVSVIMPAFNVENFIAESIKSVQGQSFTDWELLIINDGSTDKTIDVITDFLADSRIKLISQANQGVSVARNTGLNCSNGEWIAFLDGDDLWHPDFLQKLILQQQATDAEMIFSIFRRLHPDSSYTAYEFSNITGSVLLACIHNKLRIHIGAILVKKSLLTEHTLSFTVGCAYTEDTEFILKILTFASVSVLWQELLTYRRRLGSAMRSSWKYQERISDVLVYERLMNYMDANYNKSDKPLVLQGLHETLRYKKYRFLWMMIINGNIKEALHYLYAENWQAALKELYEATSLGHKIRCKIILSGNPLLWKLATLNRKLKIRMNK